jgi:aminoglycoside phosphotransferase (APT) family kinase protein
MAESAVVRPVDGTEIARRFGLGGAARLSDGPVARGKQGLVWRLDTVDGSWAVKVPLSEATEDDVRPAAEFQEAAYAAGVAAPEVRRTTDGDVFADVGGRNVRVYGWVDLLPPDALLDPDVVGGVVAAVHQVPVAPVGSVDPWYQDPVGAHRWDELVEELRHAGAPFAGRLAELREELVALESWIEPPDDLRTCHRDLWADNVLPTRDGGVCVLDWENSGLADPSQELGYVLFEFGRTDVGRARALVAAYHDAGGPGRLHRRGNFTMLIAQLGHITQIAARNWLDPNPRSPDRADSEAWISEVFDDPHTRARLDDLLAAVATTRRSRPQ